MPQKEQKIAAAVYLYQVDNDGEWGEIRFDFATGTAEIVRLAEADLASDSYDEDDKSLPSEDDSDPDPAEEGSDEQLAAQQAERVQQVEREGRDDAEDASDRIISGGRSDS